MTALNGIGEVENSDFNKAVCPDLLLSCNLQIYNLWDAAAGPPVWALFLSASLLPVKTRQSERVLCIRMEVKSRRWCLQLLFLIKGDLPNYRETDKCRIKYLIISRHVFIRFFPHRFLVCTNSKTDFHVQMFRELAKKHRILACIVKNKYFTPLHAKLCFAPDIYSTFNTNSTNMSFNCSQKNQVNIRFNF